MNKVFIYAYMQFNVGDDLFIKSLIERYPNVKFYIEADLKYICVFKKYKNLKIISNKNYKFKLFNKIKGRYIYYNKKKCKSIIFIGGSIFMEYYAWENILNWYKAMSKGKQCYIIGANFGPYQSNKYYLAYKDFFSNVTDVCFRDKYSYYLFEKCKNVRYAPDILFNLNISKYIKIKNNEKKVIISVIDCMSRREEPNKLIDFHQDYLFGIIKMINTLIKNNFKVELLSFCKLEYDERIIKEIYDNLEIHHKKLVTKFFYNGINMDELLNEIATSSYIIGTRFHSIILSSLFKKPVLPIVYSNKTENFLNDVNFKGNVIKIKNMKNINEEEIMKNYIDNIYINDDLYREDSLKHFYKLDQLLKRNNNFKN